MCEELSSPITRIAVQIHGHRLLIRELIECLRTANPTVASEIYEFISNRLDEDNETSSPELQRRNEEIRRYVGELLSTVGPEAPRSI